MTTTGTSFSGSLRDCHTGDEVEVPFTVELSENGTLWFRAAGYGDANSHDGVGYPVKIEWYEGKLWILVWGDINNEDPTHRIPLSGARESLRETCHT
jgi:hypothetical protein